MKAVDLINKIRADQGMSIAELSRRLDAGAYTTTLSTVGEYRITKDLSAMNLVRISEVLGYKAVVVPKAEADKEWTISYED